MTDQDQYPKSSLPLENDRIAFRDQMIIRLANDLADAVDVVHGEDPEFRWHPLDDYMRDEISPSAVAAIYVWTHHPMSGEGYVWLRPGMNKSRIVQLIKEKLRPKPEGVSG
jgi:hypothetical protein